MGELYAGTEIYLKESLKYFAMAINMDAHNYVGYFNFGLVLCKLKGWESGIKYLRVAYELQPAKENVAVHYILALLETNQRE